MTCPRFVEPGAEGMAFIPYGETAPGVDAADPAVFFADFRHALAGVDDHAFRAGVRDIVRKGGHGSFIFQTEEFHPPRAQTFGADRRIHGHVAAANDDDIAAGGKVGQSF